MSTLMMGTRIGRYLPVLRHRNPRKMAATMVVWAPEIRPLMRIHRLADEDAEQGHTACGLSTIGWVKVTGHQAVEQVAQTTCYRCWGVQ